MSQRFLPVIRLETEILQRIMSSLLEPRLVTLGIQNLCQYKYYGISGTTEIPGIGITAFHRRPLIKQMTTLKVFSYNQSRIPPYYSLPCDMFLLIYAKSDKVYIAATSDLALRVLTEDFNLVYTVPICTFPTSLEVNSKDHVLYVGEYGRIVTWYLKSSFYEPLVQGPLLPCPLKRHEYPFMMRYDEKSFLLLVCTRYFVYILNIAQQDIVGGYVSTESEISSAAVLPMLGYLIIGLKSGIIKIWKYQYHYLVYSIKAHTKTITGLAAYPSSPSIVSCSMDKTVCVWNVEYMTKMYSAQCEKELLGMCWDYPRVSCYSKRGVIMWTVSEPLTLFANIYTKPLRIERAIAYPGRPWILALGEDESIRILSPANGEVMTILFPMFSTDLLIDYVYSQLDNMLLVLLKTGSVLNFDTKCNPCLARELWEPPVSSQKLNCVAMCYIVSTSNKFYALVFGGQVNGNIILLFSSGHSLKMAGVCFAHKWCVTSMSGNCCLLGNSLSSSIALTTYEQEIEGTINIWALNFSESDGIIDLQCCYSILLEGNSVHQLLLTDRTLCVVLGKKRLVMLQTSNSARKTKCYSLSDFPQLHHEPNDSHKACINSLLYCPSLRIFVTSSDDGVVKFWDLSNHLVADLDIGWSLSSVGIINDFGDLLLSHQNVITRFSSSYFLPRECTSHIKRDTAEHFQDRPIPFNPNLKFWYDPSTVQTKTFCLDQRTLQQEVSQSTVTLSTLTESNGVYSSRPAADSTNRIITSISELLTSSKSEKSGFSSQFLQTNIDISKCKLGALQHICFLAARRSMLAQQSQESMQSSTCLGSFEKPPKNQIDHGEKFPKEPFLKSVASEMQFDSDLNIRKSSVAKPPIARDGFIPNSIIKSEVLKYLESQASKYSVQSERGSSFSDIAISVKGHTNDSFRKPQSFQEQKKVKKPRTMSSSVLDTREILSDTNLFKTKGAEIRGKNSELKGRKKGKKTVRISARSMSERAMFRKHKKTKRLGQPLGKLKFGCTTRKDTTSDSERYPGSSETSSSRKGSSKRSSASSKQKGTSKRKKLKRKPGGIFKQPAVFDLSIQSSQERKTFNHMPEWKESLHTESDETIASPERRISEIFKDLMEGGIMDTQRSLKGSEHWKKSLDFFKVSDAREIQQVQSLDNDKSLNERYKSLIGKLCEHSVFHRYPHVKESIANSLYRKTQRGVDQTYFKASKGVSADEVAAKSSVYEELSRVLEGHESIAENLNDILTVLHILGREGVLKESEVQELSSKILAKLKEQKTRTYLLEWQSNRKKIENVSTHVERLADDSESSTHSERSDDSIEMDIQGITKVELVPTSSKAKNKSKKKKKSSVSMSNMYKQQRHRSRKNAVGMSFKRSQITPCGVLDDTAGKTVSQGRKREKSKLSKHLSYSIGSHTITSSDTTVEYADVPSTAGKEVVHASSNKYLAKMKKIAILQEELDKAYNTLLELVCESSASTGQIQVGEEMRATRVFSTMATDNDVFDSDAIESDSIGSNVIDNGNKAGTPELSKAITIQHKTDIPSESQEMITRRMTMEDFPSVTTRIKTTIIPHIPGDDFTVRGYNCLKTFSQLITVVKRLCIEENSDVIGSLMPFLVHKNELIQKWATKSAETLLQIKSIEELQETYDEHTKYFDRKFTDRSKLKIGDQSSPGSSCAKLNVTGEAKGATYSTTPIQGIRRPTRVALQGYKSIAEVRDSSRRKSWMYKKAAQQLNMSQSVPVYYPAPNYFKKSNTIKERKSTLSIKSSDLTEPSECNKIAVSLPKRVTWKLEHTEEEEQDTFTSASLEGNWDSLSQASMNESSSQENSEHYNSKVRLFHKGAVSTRMLEKLREKARSLQALSSKQSVKAKLVSVDHSATVSVLTESRCGLSRKGFLSDMNVVKAFSKYPSLIPSSELFSVARKKYQITYEWTDLHPFVSSRYPYILDF